MTNEEAIKILEHLGIKDVEDNYVKFFCKSEEVPYRVGNALQLAIEALEKQIPKKPLNTWEPKYSACPRCKCVLDGYVANRFCHKCGQKVDWSDYD